MSKRKADDSLEAEEGHMKPWTVKHRPDPASYTTSGTIKILVGPESKVFEVHKQLLFSQSPYLSARDKPCWKEDSDEEGIKLLDIKVKQFEAILHWLYTGKLLVKWKNISERTTDWKGRDWLELYRSADLLMISGLQNQMVDSDLAFKDKNGVRLRWHVNTISIWYHKDLPHTPYFELFLKEVTCCLLGTHLESSDRAKYKEVFKGLGNNPDVLIRLLVMAADFQAKPWDSVEKGDWCEYHIHENGERCEGAKAKSANEAG